MVVRPEVNIERRRRANHGHRPPKAFDVVPHPRSRPPGQQGVSDDEGGRAFVDPSGDANQGGIEVVSE